MFPIIGKRTQYLSGAAMAAAGGRRKQHRGRILASFSKLGARLEIVDDAS